MLKVLVADDNREFNELVTEYLNRETDIEVVGNAYNGRDVIELLTVVMPDIILLDIIMPHLDGISVLEEMNKMDLPYNPRIVMLTAFGHENITQRAVELGASYYILKPFKLEILADRLRQLGRDLMPEREHTSSLIKKSVSVKRMTIIILKK
jgi:two-component system, response regulator, stage 0 sporulation protein A